jgi:4-amino-4-deoxy-L-arabinose transferase-like glycosyltransferase
MEPGTSSSRLRPRLTRANRDIIILFAVALGLRISTSLSREYVGLQGVPSLFPVNTWNDFNGYVDWLRSVSQGMVPYRDLFTYKYTPLFLYILYPFYAIGGAYPAAIPIIVSDAATSPLIYLIALRLSRERIALLAGLGYAFSPLALYNEGYLWLSSQPMAFFMLLAVCLLRSGRSVLSAFFMGLAVMVKQEALFLLPAYWAGYVSWSRRLTLKGVLTFAATLFAVSLPFLFISPINYIESLNYLKALPPSAATGCVSQVISNVTVAVCGGTTSGLSALASSASALAGFLPQPGGFPLEYALNRIAEFTVPVLFLVISPALFVVRRAKNSLELFAVYSMMGLLTLYWLLGHPVFEYYLIPVYALLLASAVNYRCLLVGIIIPTASLILLPDSPIQSLLLLFALLAVIALQGEGAAVTELVKRAVRDFSSKD